MSSSSYPYPQHFKALESIPDPRRPSEERRYIPPKVKPEDLPPDYYALFSLVFGVTGLMVRYKWASWLALYFGVASIANMRYSEMDTKQVLSSLMFSIMGLLVNYLSPVPQR
eukprot:GEZU01021444.1.p1 GENE.GEZU01021444.1~~GEZU01021444.1.p1  ORF type:complete len:112 (-),score=1.95 GEZU01021444.1:143-478(-)